MASTIVLKKHEERRILGGHQWVFSNEISSIEGSPGTGDVVDIVRHDRRFVGSGLFHPHSLIAVRILGTEHVEPDKVFFRARIEQAYRLRQSIVKDAEAYRLVHGESDYLPGLVIDRYKDCFVLQVQSAGMDMRMETICDVVEELFHPAAIVVRNDSALRILEQLPHDVRILRGSGDVVRINEHGVNYDVHLLTGQKTGLFLDQRVNRRIVRPYLSGRAVIDCFCNDGGFALNASAAGATTILGIEVSADAVARATHNASTNQAENVTFQAADVFDLLREKADAGERCDAIILDPPSFTKSKKTVATALHGYVSINTLAMRMLTSGGILVTASCSHHIGREAFLDMLHMSARKAGRSIQMLELHGASPDHPVLPAMPETSYLKFAIISVR
ncbi:MAG: hypothetical protein A2X67_01780 [Ignavibacteria bacterium GWA2_55_11]|nr:MAG: hypothetical protein A2X67_01780 [Ignavibacteria bacterium GWA2_55_11]OGU63123.1 MAG: hypothetical protein A3C56_10075 [Ignavibacteria bacterium RIFCSPHIGHO2_02_FULL_56_12]OGU71327.1 MAG: hypothetical protein A3G43_13655 [Ignavibacteria bacterium RIFCSPLOWO2_12_FULL_56_21]OGU75572.1 MAG: hypothetical protein A3H45_11345 [Ignavibacteria bacterium RIFCSPLOWO2_02_FULL_55_14]